MKTTIKKCRSILAMVSMATLALAEPAAATQFSCAGGTIVTLGTYIDGTVAVNLGYGVIFVCSLSATSYGVTADTCRGWYSTLLSQRLANKSVRLYFDDTSSTNIGLTPAMCTNGAAFPTVWTPHVPFFFEPQL